ncbi:MAG: TIGR03085 family metal-binding protein [Ornithinimicrobium sp.]
MNLAQERRAELCDGALRAGPDAPTLCTGWTVRDLLVHLIVRERRPDAMVGEVVPPLRGHAARVRADLSACEFGDLAARVRSGPPRLSPTSLRAVDDVVNTMEFVLHHVDIVRGAGAITGPVFDDATQQAMLTTLRRLGRILFRRSPVGVVVIAPGRGRAALRRPTRGHGSVVLTGEPVELLVYASGRRDHASVQVSGDQADKAALAAAPLGL